MASRLHSETLPTREENTPDEVKLSRELAEKEIINSNIPVQQRGKPPTDDNIIVNVDEELSTLASSSHSRKFERSNTGSHPHSYSGKSAYGSSFESGQHDDESSHFSSEYTRAATASQYLSAGKSPNRVLQQHTAGSRRSYTTFDSEYESTSEFSSGSNTDEGGKDD